MLRFTIIDQIKKHMQEQHIPHLLYVFMTKSSLIKAVERDTLYSRCIFLSIVAECGLCDPYGDTADVRNNDARFRDWIEEDRHRSHHTCPTANGHGGARTSRVCVLSNAMTWIGI